MYVPLDHPHHHPFTVNMTVNLFAILVFTTLQTLFWWFFASQEVVHNIKRQASILSDAREVLRRRDRVDEALILDAEILRIGRAARPLAANDAARQDAANRRRLNLWIVPVIGGVAIMLVVCVVYNLAHRHRLSFGHRMGLAMVLASYIPEILLFLFVIEQYKAIGDHEIMRRSCGFLQPT